MTTKQRIVRGKGPEIHCAHTELVKLDRLKPNPRNPNQHPATQITLLASIISEQGWRAPITVSTRSGFIVRGHGRLEAAKHLGVVKAPVDYQDYPSDEAELADLLADNRIAELAHIDDDLLGEVLFDLASTDLDSVLTGFCTIDLNNLIENHKINIGEIDTECDADAKIEKKEELRKRWDTKTGQLWGLGRHRVFCGDCLDRTNMHTLLDGESPDLVFTDPMYDDDTKGLVVCFDELKTKHFLLMLTLKQILSFIPHSGYDFKFDLVFTQKTPSSMLNKRVPYYLHKNIVYLSKDNTTLFHCDNAKGTISDAGYYPSVFEASKDTQESHPLTKDANVLKKILCGFEFETLLDMFIGSGSTLLAAEQLGRRCFGMEIDPGYMAVVLERYSDATGKQPKLITG